MKIISKNFEPEENINIECVQCSCTYNITKDDMFLVNTDNYINTMGVTCPVCKHLYTTDSMDYVFRGRYDDGFVLEDGSPKNPVGAIYDLTEQLERHINNMRQIVESQDSVISGVHNESILMTSNIEDLNNKVEFNSNKHLNYILYLENKMNLMEKAILSCGKEDIILDYREGVSVLYESFLSDLKLKN